MDKKIAFILSNLAQGGSERQMVNLSEALATKGFKVDVITYYASDFYDLSSSTSGVNYICLDCKNKFDRIRKIRKYYKMVRPQIVITLVDRPAVYALISAIGINLRFILTWRNSNCGVFSSLTGKVINTFNRKIKAIICNSYNSMNLWAKYRPKDSEKLFVIYNLIKQHEKIDELIDVSDGGIRVITIAARVVPDKNAESLIEAVSGIDRRLRSKMKIKWYGNPDDSQQYYKKMIALRDANGLNDTLIFEPPVKNIYKVMIHSDAVGLFSHREGFPNAICEGLQIGKPIIVTPVSDYNVFVNGNGFLCSSDNAEDIRQALEMFLLTSDDELKTMGVISRGIFEEKFDYKKIIQEWMIMLENLE